MTNTFSTMVARIARELNRTNMTVDIQAAVNDAITEGAATRFYFNEILGLTFQTVIGQEYYPDLNFTEVDSMYWFNGTARWNMWPINKINADLRAVGTTPNGPPTEYSRSEQMFRFYTIPNLATTVFVDGYGKLDPWPLVNDGDTNAWMTEGERYIRAVAKRIVLTDRVRDFAEASIQDSLADGYMTQLLDMTTKRIGTGELTPTQF